VGESRAVGVCYFVRVRQNLDIHGKRETGEKEKRRKVYRAEKKRDDSTKTSTGRITLEDG